MDQNLCRAWAHHLADGSCCSTLFCIEIALVQLRRRIDAGAWRHCIYTGRVLSGARDAVHHCTPDINRTMHRDALMHPYVCKQWVVESVANSSKNTVTITNSPIVSLPRMFCMPSSWRCKRWGTYSKYPLGVIQWTQVAMNILLMMCNSAAYKPVVHWVTTQCSPPGCHVAHDSWCTRLQTQNCSMQLLSPLQAMHMIQTFTCQINCVWFCPCLFHSRLDHIWNTKKMKLFSLLFVERPSQKTTTITKYL